MKIVVVHSHFAGLEYLTVHKKRLWMEVRKAIQNIEAETCRAEIRRTSRRNQPMYNSKEITANLGSLLTAADWKKSYITHWKYHHVSSNRLLKARSTQTLGSGTIGESSKSILTYFEIDHLKDRVAVNVRLASWSNNADDLFEKHHAFYVRDEIDVGIEILPMKSLQQHMSSGPGYYEGELYNVIRNGRGVPAVPLVVIGVAP